MEIDVGANTKIKHTCKKCKYTCFHMGNFNKHLKTKKHTANYTSKLRKCACGKVYAHASGLSRHKKICNRANHMSDEATAPALVALEASHAPEHFTSIIRDLLDLNEKFKKENIILRALMMRMHTLGRPS